MTSQKNRIAALIAIATTVTLVGCGQDQVSNPATDTFSGTPIPLPVSERPASQGLHGLDLPSVTVLVSAETGGTVKLGRYTLEFPAGALTSDTPITITQTDPNAMVLELEPHGIQFSKPVTLSAHVGDLVSSHATTVGVAWMNESTGNWEVVEQEDAGAAMTSAGLWHFSDYSFWSN